MSENCCSLLLNAVTAVDVIFKDDGASRERERERERDGGGGGGGGIQTALSDLVDLLCNPWPYKPEFDNL